jgi:quercetin dioxygenase-like cupin family protein
MKLQPDTAPVVDPALDAELLEALAPIDPGATSARSILARVEERIARAPAAAFLTIHKGEGEWRSLAPRVSEKRLVDQAGLYACLIRMEKGGTLPPHDHATPEECVVLEGEVWLGDVHCRAGDFHLAPAGLRHGALRTDEGCLLYVRTGGRPGAALL